LVTDVFGFIYVLSRFWDQRSRSQQAVSRKTGEHTNSTNNERNFTKSWPQMQMGLN